MLSRIFLIGVVVFVTCSAISFLSQSPMIDGERGSTIESKLVGTWKADRYIINGGTTYYDLLRDAEFRSLSITLEEEGRFCQRFRYEDGSGYELIGNWELSSEGSKLFVNVEKVSTLNGGEKMGNTVSISYTFNIITLDAATLNFDFVNHEYQMNVEAELTKQN